MPGSKLAERKKAISLRKRGFSYGEILKKVPVTKASLSLWLRDIQLNKKQKHRLYKKKLASAALGWNKVRVLRLQRIAAIDAEARREMYSYHNDPLWLIGTVLYWGEGHKPKPWRTAEKVAFSNMDHSMILIFIKWAGRFLKVVPEHLVYELYIHESLRDGIDEVKTYWAGILGIPSSALRVYFKKNKRATHRRNIGVSYHGVLRVWVKRSTALNHKISVWIRELSKQYCGVV